MAFALLAVGLLSHSFSLLFGIHGILVCIIYDVLSMVPINLLLLCHQPGVCRSFLATITITRYGSKIVLNWFGMLSLAFVD